MPIPNSPELRVKRVGTDFLRINYSKNETSATRKTALNQIKRKKKNAASMDSEPSQKSPTNT
jgi:hypothetical protein